MLYTISQFNKEFPNDNACLDYMFNARYGRDYKCPKCGKKGFYRIKGRKCYSCAWCGYQIHPTADTIFHKSSTKLTDWFFAIYLFSTSKNGVSAKELQRHLGCTYKTAWRIAKQIRSLMKQDGRMLGGVVEADETYIGGKGHITGRGTKKAPVMGMVQRGGKVIAKKITEPQAHILLGELQKNIKFGSRLITDNFPSYKRAMRLGYKHDVINHSKGKFAKGDIHTNTIEGFWGQMKRSIDGTYHSISKKYLQDYLNECAFSWNSRVSSSSSFSLLLSSACGQHGLEGGKSPLFEEVKVS